MAVKTVNTGYIPSWVVSLSQFGNPGSGSGLMFGKPFQSHIDLYFPRAKQSSEMPNGSVFLDFLQSNLWKY